MRKLSLIGILLLFLMVLFQLQPVQAARLKTNSAQIIDLGKYVQVSNHQVYVEYVPPTKGQPLLVLTNGLVFNLERWNEFTAEAKKLGYGYLRYYFRGQHLTLKKEVETSKTPEFFKNGLNVELMATELNELLTSMKIQGPFVLVGLSYGSTIAAEYAQTYPKNIQKLVFMAPLVISLDNYNPQGSWMLQNLDMIKLWWGPILGPMLYETAYRQIYQSYLGQQIIPEKIPEELAQIPDVYKESLFHLIRVTRNFDLRKYSFNQLPKNSVHFFLAHEDDQRFFDDQEAAYSQVSPHSQGALVWMTKAGHAIPESDGVEVLSYLDSLIKGDKLFEAGRKYQVTEKGLERWK